MGIMSGLIMVGTLQYLSMLDLIGAGMIIFGIAFVIKK
jgi:hypothetical protein